MFTKRGRSGPRADRAGTRAGRTSCISTDDAVTSVRRRARSAQSDRPREALVNHIGEIGLDGAILREADGEVPMAVLANGCICCQGTSDLAATIDRLLSTQRPGHEGPIRRFVLETSGLSKPGPLLRQLSALAGHRLRVSVVVTYDPVVGLGAERFEEAAARWAAARRIVTKADLISAERVDEARAEISGINPITEIIADVDRQATVCAAFSSLAVPPAVTLAPAAGASRHPRVGVRLAHQTGDLTYADLALWLDNLAEALGERLLRLKGLVESVGSERPVLVQSVGTLFSQPRPFAGPEADVPPQIVMIGRDISDDEILQVEPAGHFVLVDRTISGMLSRPQPRFLRCEAT